MANLAEPTNDLKFPPKRDRIKAQWLPLFIEPMVGSGERLAIGVAVANEQSFLVVPVVSLERLNCLYGKENEALIYAANTALDSFKGALAKEGAGGLQTWVTPFEGIIKGDIRIGAGNSLDEIARSALMLCSSLVEKLAESEEETEIAQQAASDNRLEQLIKEKVLSEKPALENFFNKDFQASKNARKTKIGYVGRNIAANFTLLVPTYLSRRVRDAKAKLWDLAQVQEYVQDDSFRLGSNLDRFELLINRVSEEDPQYSDRQILSVKEAINELEIEADKKDIRCRPLYSPDEIAQIIIDTEAA